MENDFLKNLSQSQVMMMMIRVVLGMMKMEMMVMENEIIEESSELRMHEEEAEMTTSDLQKQTQKVLWGPKGSKNE